MEDQFQRGRLKLQVRHVTKPPKDRAGKAEQVVMSLVLVSSLSL